MVEHPSRFSILSNTSLLKEQLVEEAKRKSNDSHKAPSDKRNKSPTRKNVIPGEDGFRLEDFDPAYLQEAYAKKLRKHMRERMNLQCKTVSIVGIPSQLRESTIFNQTQTTTSLNAIDPTEDGIEKKKKSKRFKLYYKYSAADNKGPHGSDKSSEGKKSVVSDSYKVVSDPSDNNVDVWEEEGEDVKKKDKESDVELAKVLFIMKKEKLQKSCGDAFVNRVAAEHVPKNTVEEVGARRPSL